RIQGVFGLSQLCAETANRHAVLEGESMAWNVPSVFVAEQQLTAAALNLYLRDNLLETETAKATEAGQLLVTAGPNSVAMRKPIEHSVNETVTTTSTTPVTL